MRSDTKSIRADALFNRSQVVKTIAELAMSRQIRHPVLILPLLGLAFLTACTSSPNAGPSVKDTKPARWVATVDHGDKPANAYELIVRDGKVTEGKFYLLAADKPHDLNSAGQTVAFQGIKLWEKEITFSITLAAGNGTSHAILTITLGDKLEGALGEQVSAKVKFIEANTAAQDLVFVRRQ